MRIIAFATLGWFAVLWVGWPGTVLCALTVLLCHFFLFDAAPNPPNAVGRCRHVDDTGDRCTHDHGHLGLCYFKGFPK